MFYKYFNPNLIDKVLTESLIRFTQPIYFNDPFEVFPTIESLVPISEQNKFVSLLLNNIFTNPEEYIDDEIKYIMESNGLNENNLKQLISIGLNLPGTDQDILNLLLNLAKNHFFPAIKKKLETTFGILCLSSIPNNLLMWGHYTDSHKGFVLELDETHPFFNQKIDKNDLIRQVQKINYKEERPKIYLLDYNPDNLNQFLEYIIKKFFLIKSKEWEYENELRMIIPLNNSYKIIKEDNEDIYLYKLPTDCIVSIISGCKIIKNDKEKIQKIILENKKYFHIKIKQAQMDLNEYKLNIICKG